MGLDDKNDNTEQDTKEQSYRLPQGGFAKTSTEVSGTGVSGTGQDPNGLKEPSSLVHDVASEEKASPEHGFREASIIPGDVLDENEEEDSAEFLGGVEDDPLGSAAFDLDEGRPLQGELSGETRGGMPWRSRVDSAKEFFAAEILYRYDLLAPADKEKMKGNYRVELKGFRGGVWTITLGGDLVVVNRKEDADVVLVLQQHDFLQLVNGELNPQLAILSEKIRITGDVRRAIAFELLLVPENS